MQVSESAFVSPVLRLSADVWAQVAGLLQAGDIARLLDSGCTPLAGVVAAGARRVELSWRIPRFIDLDLAFASASRLKRLSSFTFAAQNPSQLFWMPVNWSFLPRTLVSLELAFYRSIEIATHSHPIGSMLPVLENLKLVDVRTDASYFYGLIDFRQLPPSLLNLDIEVRSATYCFPIEHLVFLPPHLQSFHLSGSLLMNCSEVQFEKADPAPTPSSISSSPFPKLPSTLQSLVLPDMARLLLHLDPSVLPTSLTTLRVSLFSVDLPLMRRMVNLKELAVRGTMINPEELQQYLPPSITTLDVSLSGGAETMSKDVLSNFLSKLDDYCCGYMKLDNFIFSGDFALPRLKTLNAFDYEGDQFNHIPTSITTIHSLPRTSAELPSALRFLSVRHDPNTIATLPPSLTSLHLDENWSWDSSFLPKLPTALQSFSGNFWDESWLKLLERMRLPGCLPKLVEIGAYNPMPALLLFDLPSQLQKLQCIIFHDYDKEAPLSSDLFASLASSKLIDLNISALHFSSSDSARLLESLPPTLRVLRFDWDLPSDYVPLEKLTITLPEHLLDFTFYQNAQTSNSGRTLQRFEFRLPHSLTSLVLHETPLVPETELPPYLSVFRGDHNHNTELVAKWQRSLESLSPLTGSNSRKLV